MAVVAVEALRFANMKAAGEVFAAHNRHARRRRRSLPNKGVSGGWRDALSAADIAADLALDDIKVRGIFSPALAAWVKGGRRAAGDPRFCRD